MVRTVEVLHESLALAREFRISRAVKTHADVVLLRLEEGGHWGRGESVPYPRYGESVGSVMAQIEALRPALEKGLTRQALQAMLPPGAARNAIDCALWDLEAKREGVPVAALAGRSWPDSLPTVQTLSLDSPEAMAREAAALAEYPALKIKLAQDGVLERLRAIRQAAPKPQLLIDANEAWSMEFLAGVEPALWDLGVRLLEQPLPAEKDEGLKDFQGRVPICADEACHTSRDLVKLKGKYAYVNIKLDKAGGLTEALTLLDGAKKAGFGVMVGCMVGSSLGIAPAMLLAGEADFVDLDGPTWLADDRPHGLHFQAGRLVMPDHRLWGFAG